MDFDLTAISREQSWTYLINRLESMYKHPEKLKASFIADRKKILGNLNTDFDRPHGIKEVIDIAIDGLNEYTIHTSHPMHFGMFNPRSNFPSILADTITASINPQLAAWSHAPFAVEVEQVLIENIGERLGFSKPHIFGTFTTGGQEANLTSLVAALNNKFPDYNKNGLRGINGHPKIYCSKASHHATVKAAKVCGLGTHSIAYIDVDSHQRMKVKCLENQILNDIARGNIPTLIVATLGTTGAGAIDPIDQIASLGKKYGLWLHADAAYGGGIALSNTHKQHIKGIERADSITFDLHKWLSVPMGTSMFITKHKHILAKSFSIGSDYMPEEEGAQFGVSPYSNSIQWSRRFNGLKLYMALLVFGWKGYEKTINHQMAMGRMLKKKLENNNWVICNNSPLPVICFTDPEIEDDEDFATFIYESCLETGDTWINKYPIADQYTLRVCITNYATEEKHLDQLIDLLNKKRQTYKQQL